MEKGLANFLSHATFTSTPGPIARNPPASGRLDHWHPGGGDATRLPTSQWLHDEPGTAPLRAERNTRAWHFGDVTPVMVPPFGHVLLPE